MARKSSIENFLEGFNAGYDTVGKVGADYKIAKLSQDEGKSITKGLTPNEDGMYSVFGMEFKDKPDQFDISTARSSAQAKIYDQWGMGEKARGLRSDALTGRKQGQDYKTSIQAYDQAEEMNPLMLAGKRTLNNNAHLTGLGLEQAQAQNDVLNPLLVQNQRETNRGLQIQNDHANIINILKVEYQDLVNEGQGGSNKAQQIAVDIAEATKQAQIALRKATSSSAVSSAKVDKSSIAADIAKRIAESALVKDTLKPNVQAAIARGNIAELEAEFALATFPIKLGMLGTDSEKAREELERMLKENPVKLTGLVHANILAGLNVDAAKLDNKQKAKIDIVNKAYYNALVNGEYEDIEKSLMPHAVQAYNSTMITDDANKAVLDENDGKYYIFDDYGKRIGAAIDILKELPIDQKQELIRTAQAYAVGSITGDPTVINEFYKNNAWIDYYTAKSADTTLTKTQWAIQRFNANPLDKLAVAMLAGDNFNVVQEQLNDPAYQLKNLATNGAVPPPVTATATETTPVIDIGQGTPDPTLTDANSSITSQTGLGAKLNREKLREIGATTIDSEKAPPGIRQAEWDKGDKGVRRRLLKKALSEAEKQ